MESTLGDPSPMQIYNEIAVTLEAQVPNDVGVAFKNFMQTSPEAEAIVRHIATIPFRLQRLRLLRKWKDQIKYESAYYPVDAEWFILNIVFKQTPSDKVIWWQQNCLRHQPLAIFSYFGKEDGLLKRYIFTLVTDKENISPDDHVLAYQYKDEIISKGGIAAVRTAPQIRWNSINVVIGPICKAWSQYLIKLYSLQLIQDALDSKIFDTSQLEKYRIVIARPPRLNLANIAKLV